MYKLLAAYGVTGRERQAIAALTETARAGWWSEYRGRLPGAMVDHALFESVADNIVVYEPQALPAFLQTGSYAASLIEVDPSLRTGEERQLAVLLAARQAANVAARPHAVFTVVIGEAALRHHVGGEAMLGQLRHLASEVSELPAPVTLRVIPFTAGAHPAIGAGPVSIMRFRDVSGIGAVYQGWGTEEVLVARQRELTAAVRRFEALQDVALSPDGSRRLIREVIDDWR